MRTANSFTSDLAIAAILVPNAGVITAADGRFWAFRDLFSPIVC
jgi:hypothetical protein